MKKDNNKLKKAGAWIAIVILLLRLLFTNVFCIWKRGEFPELF